MRSLMSIVVFVFLLALGLINVTGGRAAESKCTTTSSVCTDGRTGEPRTCVTTVCVDGNGNVLSTNTVVLLKQQGTKKPTGGRVPTKGQSSQAVVGVAKVSPLKRTQEPLKTETGIQSGGALNGNNQQHIGGQEHK
jgi:hypothetical protein